MYLLIKENRESKGFPISMHADDITKLFTNYPNDYLGFTVRDNNKLIASSIGVKVNSGVLYYFLPAYSDQYHSYSPMVFLLDGMYSFCQKNKFEILDLGIATAQGIPNEGLIKFKEHLGAKKSLKLSFYKRIQ
jgi:hypothetical protein